MVPHVNWSRPHPPLATPAPCHPLVDHDSVAAPERSNPLEHQCGHQFFAIAAGNRRLAEYLHLATVETRG